MSDVVHGLCELTLQTPDPARLSEFYINVLGLEVLERADDRVWLTCGPTTRLGLWTPGEKEFGDQGAGAASRFTRALGSAVDKVTPGA